MLAGLWPVLQRLRASRHPPFPPSRRGGSTALPGLPPRGLPQLRGQRQGTRAETATSLGNGDGNPQLSSTLTRCLSKALHKHS